jgi:hypothetical protein
MKSFIYHWYINDEINKDGEKELVIRAYGIKENHETVLLHIKNFCPWLYLEISKDEKTSTDWIHCKSFIKNKLVERCKSLAKNTFYVVQKKKIIF